jgi:MraZ protein
LYASGLKWGKVDNNPKMILTGTYRHIIDEKNRLFLPAKLRRGKSRFIVTPGLDKCIYVYPLETWVNIIDRLDDITLKDKTKQRVFKRVFLSDAVEVQPDDQGRIVVPQTLKDQSSIGKEVVVIGVRNHLEIWAEGKWRAYYEKSRKIFNQLATKLDI